MKRTTKHMILTGAGVLVLAVMAAGAGAYVTQEMMDDHSTAARKASGISWNTDRQTAAPQPQRVASACDDGNIVGTIKERLHFRVMRKHALVKMTGERFRVFIKNGGCGFHDSDGFFREHDCTFFNMYL